MSLVEAAQRLMDDGGPLAEDAFCRLCHKVIVGFAHVDPEPHAPGCPVLALPRIVAVLEAAERIADGDGAYDVTSADFEALVAALRGENEPA